MYISDIKDIYQKYQRKFPDIVYPELDEKNYIVSKRNSYFFRLLATDLYKGNVILYIDKSVFELEDSEIESILFHEFTHIYDSVKFRDTKSITDFKEIMSSYSEIHAQHIYLKSKVNFIKNLQLQNKIRIHKKEFTIQEYFENRVRFVNEKGIFEFCNQSSKFFSNNLMLMYFIGDYMFIQETRVPISLNIKSPFKDEIMHIIKNYPSNPNNIVIAQEKIFSKYKEYRNSQINRM